MQKYGTLSYKVEFFSEKENRLFLFRQEEKDSAEEKPSGNTFFIPRGSKTARERGAHRMPPFRLPQGWGVPPNPLPRRRGALIPRPEDAPPHLSLLRPSVKSGKEAASERKRAAPRRMPTGTTKKGSTMSKYVILTDTACDLPREYLEKREIETADLTYRFEGEDREYTVRDMPITDFFVRMREGAVAKTSALNTETLYHHFKTHLEKGKDVLYIAFSSGLSGTYNAGRLAAERARADFPDRKIAVVDSLCASGGEGLLVALAADKRDAGADFEELLAYVQDTVLRVAHWFTVDDLVYLKRGGRVSPTAAFFGNMLGIKPVLHVDNEGHLIPMAKVRGRRTSVVAMAEKLFETRDPSGAHVFINHADCEKDALLLKSLIEEKTDARVDLITDIGPVIGAHSGPGTLALFFLAKER